MLLKNRSWHQLEIFTFFCLCFLANATASNNLSCDAQDFTALLGFLDDLESGIGGWGSDSQADCCACDGVTCEFVSEVPNIWRVVSLELPNKRLKGKLNKCLAGLTYLKVLNLSNNFFSDHLPHELFRYEFLELLDLSYNGLLGNLTVEIRLPSLKLLDLSHNFLQGLFNRKICGVAKRLQVLRSFLEVLSPGSNYFEKNLPEDLFQLPKLRQLTLQNNRFAGLLSPSSSKLSNIVEFDISSNGFFGTIPDAFYNLQNLKRFSADSNRFAGSLPPSLSSVPSISSLSVRNNSLSGSIVLKSFENFASLYHLSLSNCSLQNLTATLEILQHCKNLSSLVLTLNFWNEKMPTDLNLQFKSLNILALANCGLTGSIPNWLQTSTNLHLLDLSWNRLSGTIPNFFNKMKFLFYLDFSRNMLSEGIPTSLTKLASLINQNVTLEEHSENSALFSKGKSAGVLKYNQVLAIPPTLDLSSNYLTGPILAELGNLIQLHVLNLNNNSLSGYIPETLSNITSLEILDSLVGTIPPSFAKLSFLSNFSVAFNKLSGHIPTGGQFTTFPNSSFEGNIDLLEYESSSGSSVSKQKPRNDRVETSDGEDSIIGLPFAIGSVTAFVIVVTVSYLSGWLFPKDHRDCMEEDKVAATSLFSLPAH